MAVNDMSWLIEASRKAQEKRQQFASPSISQHIPTGFTGLGEQRQPAFKMPLSPREKAGQIIEQMRQEQAQRPVVPTLSAKRLMEDIRSQQEAEKLAREQWAYQLERDKLADERYEREWQYKVAQDAIANAARSRGANALGLGLYNTLGSQKERIDAATGHYQRIVQEAIAGGESLKNIANDIVDAVPEMTYDGVNPADILRFAIAQFGQQYESQRWQPGMTTDIKWFQNYKWYLDNKDKLWKQADALERQFKPEAPATGAEALTAAERQRIAEILGIPVTDVDLYIRTNPALISQLLGKQYGSDSDELQDIMNYRP